MTMSGFQYATMSGGRVDWVDFAKGFCIIFVVMMHSTLGVEKYAGEIGWMHYAVAFAKPFRMPDFFLISGLFLSRVIDRNWRLYIDRRVIHFFYFYALWVTIQFGFKAPGMLQTADAAEVTASYLWAYVQPFGTLWFIYILPLFAVTTRLLKHVHWTLVLAVAALLEIAPVHTGSLIIDEFAARYVYFYAGYRFAPLIFGLAERAMANGIGAACGLGIWALINGIAVFSAAPDLTEPLYGAFGMENAVSFADLPIISFALGLAGAIAIVLFASLLSPLRAFAWTAYLGTNSIVVYLAFFLPMAISRTLLLKFAPQLDVGSISVIVTACGVAGPVIGFWIIRYVGIGGFLFTRPKWARMKQSASPPAMHTAPAE